ncbi:PocR ligand-binding domain-containing protein [Trichloromonas sp.]|uniref:PocR ligand-binding domain-containing protein n=1 Tax=Trichloromonas sp. TaxID=3069249 RepID=UPI003D81B26C
MEYLFSEIVDVPEIQGLMESLYKASGIPCGIIDVDGRVLVASGWQKICTCFHRVHPETAALCRQSDAFMQQHLQQGSPLPAEGFVEYRCKNGMIDIALPIVIDGRHLANLFLGQFFYTPPEEGFFVRQARRYGFDSDRYLEALRSVPIFPREKVAEILEYQSRFVALLVRMGVQRLERIRAAEENEQVRARLEESQRIARLGSWEWNLLTGELHCSPQAIRNLGLDAETFVPTYHSLLAKVPADDRTLVRRSIDQALHTGEVWVEHRIVRPDGSIRYLLEQGEVVIGDNREPLRMLGTCQDITEQKQVEIALLESEQRLQNILDNSNALVYLKGLDGRYLFVNRCFEKLFGLDHGQAVNLSDPDLLPAAQAEKFRANDQAVLEGDAPLQFEEEVLLEDGVHTYLSVKFPLHSSEGRAYAVCGISTDISERKQAEETVREALALAEEARDNVHAVFKAVADGLIVTDIDRRVVLINRSAEKLLGIRSDRTINRAIAEVLAPAGLRKQIEAAFVADDEGCPLDLEMHRENGGGTVVVQARSAAVFSSQRGQSGVITILRDVTRERELDRMKNEFISTAAHELRTPLTSVLGFTQVLLQSADYGIREPEQQRELLGHIAEKASSLKVIIDDLFDLSRVQAGQMLTLNLEPSDICGLLRQIVDSYRKTYDNHPFELLLPDECPIVRIDQKKIVQVMENLLSNATKFSPAGSPIKVTGSVCGGRFRFSVEDRGIGMTAEQVERVFDKFYRGDASNTAVGGLGLGMSIVKSIIDGHEGRIWVESEPGRGTQVVFTLPLAFSPGI